MRRIAYSPEVRVYIQPNETDSEGKLVPPIDISKDIIEGSIERRSNDISTARFVIQGRRLGKENDSDSTTSILLSRKIRPMDRIIVYLKKTKPILVFSGYIDLVPLVQFVPEPVVIEASCSLKRLQYTYWDPTLPNVMQALIEMGMIVQKNDSGFNVFQSPGSDSTGTGNIEDQGFPKLLSFLLIDVGGWNPDTVYIEPLPQEWLDTVEPMFRNFVIEDQTWESAKAFLDAWLGANPTPDTDGGGDGYGGGTAHPFVDIELIKKVLNEKKAADWVVKNLEHFVGAGNKYNIDPKFLIAISMFETGWGRSLAGKNNIGGLYGGSRAFESIREAIYTKAGPIFLSGPRYKDTHTAATIGRIYAPVGASNDPNGTNSEWPDSVGNIYDQLGGSGGKNAIVKGPEYKKALDAKKAPTRNAAAKTGTRDKKTLTVYLEAVGSGTENEQFLQGYQKKDFFVRGYESDSSKNRMAKNRDVAKRIKDNVNTLIKDLINSNGPGSSTFGINWSQVTPFKNVEEFLKNIDEDFDPIDIKIVNHSNVTKGWKGDIYLAIDHSDEERKNDICYCLTPAASTPNLTNPSADKKIDFGSNWKKPSSVFGRDTLKDKGLIQNSNQFRNSLITAKKYSKSTVHGNGLTISPGGPSLGGTVTVAQNSWRGAIPGFFYTAASTCAYLQLPNKGEGYTDKQSSGYIPETDDWAWQIAYALFEFYVKIKYSNKLKTIEAGGSPLSDDREFVYEELTAEGFKLDRGGENNDWGGAMWRCLALQKLTGIKPSSQKRDTQKTESGGNSDHWVGKKSAYAMDLPGTPNDGTTNEGASKVVKALGGPDRWGYQDHASDSFNVTYDGYRYQVIWRSNIGGNHYDHIHIGVEKTGATQNLPLAGVDVTGDGGTDSESEAYQNAINFNRAAFNVSYQFPGSLVDSILLRGKRALQNDVPLLDSVKEITIGSMRNFASLPNGDFMAWYPDYFNIAKRNPWLRISQVEIKKCTIDFSDKALTTHVYIMGNPYGIGNLPTAYSDWYEKLQGAGVITIEQKGILESFLYSKINKDDPETRDSNYEDTHDDEGKNKSSAEMSLNFLEKYGARPYTESNLTIRHPLVEFFYAYNTFMTKWAEQFISRAEFTFMPELFPGMTIEIPNYQEEQKSFTFYVQDVTHTFSYTGGFSTSAILIAPGMANYEENQDPIGMVPVRPPSKNRPATSYKIEPTSGKKQKYIEWLNGRKSTEKLAAQWKQLNNVK